MDLLHQSITEVLEEPFIEEVLARRSMWSMLFNIKGLEIENAWEINDALVKRRVGVQAFDKKFRGDIDILVVPKRHPEFTTAIQVKRFPMAVTEGSDDWVQGRMQRLFDEGVEQANRDARIGFSQVYLWVFVLIDTRKRNAGRNTYEGLDGELRSKVDYVFSPVNLLPRVGLIKFDWGQPRDRPPLELGTSGAHTLKDAERTTQPPELTEWLKSLTPTANDLVIPSRR